MSYILEALKKSDEERNRGTTPGFQTVHTASVRETAKPRWRLYLLTCALLLNAGMLLWWLQPWRHSGADIKQLSGSGLTVPAENEHPKIAANEHPAEAMPAGPTLPAAPGAVQEQAKKELPSAQPRHDKDNTVTSGSENTQSAGEQKERNDQLKTAPPAVEPGYAAQQSARKGVEAEQTVPSLTPAVPAKSAETAHAERTKPPEPAIPTRDRPAPKQQNLGTENADQLAKMHAKALDEALKSPAKIVKPDSRVGKAEAAAESSVPHLRSLPMSTRQQIPDLSLSFLVYSDNPADRMVNINGLMMREGQEVAPGLKLEEITPEGATFNFRGIRFRKGIL